MTIHFLTDSGEYIQFPDGVPARSEHGGNLFCLSKDYIGRTVQVWRDPEWIDGAVVPPPPQHRIEVVITSYAMPVKAVVTFVRDAVRDRSQHEMRTDMTWTVQAVALSEGGGK